MICLLALLALPLAADLNPAETRPPAVRPAPAGSEAALLQEAKDLRWKGRFFEAAAIYRQFITGFTASGRLPEARFWLAAVLEQDQRWDEAAAAYTTFLQAHPDQRMLGREARLNRLRCWGIRQGQGPGASEGLLAALQEPEPEIRVAAALQLSRRGDRRAIPALREGLALPKQADAATMALLALGEKPPAPPSSAARYLVIRIQESGKKDPVTVRLTLALARAVTGYLNDAMLQEARRKGVDLDNLTQVALGSPKGTELLSVSDGKQTVTIRVE